MSAIFGLVGNFFSGLFGFKKEQGAVLSDAIKVIDGATTSTAKEVQAIAAIIQAEAGSEKWIVAAWRPLMMLLFGGLLVSYWLGYAPPDIDKPLSPMMAEIFTLLKLGIGGYIGGRTLEKVVKSFNVGAIVKSFIDKKIM